MNIKKIILAFAASAMLAGGCTSLDMDPVSDITDLNYWKTPEQFDSFVFAVFCAIMAASLVVLIEVFAVCSAVLTDL